MKICERCKNEYSFKTVSEYPWGSRYCCVECFLNMKKKVKNLRVVFEVWNGNNIVKEAINNEVTLGLIEPEPHGSCTIVGVRIAETGKSIKVDNKIISIHKPFYKTNSIELYITTKGVAL